jgi:hypothetical protein
MMHGKGFDPKWDVTLTQAEAVALAPVVIDLLREFTAYGLCRQKNAFERKAMAEKFAELAREALRKFPQLDLNKMGAETRVV